MKKATSGKNPSSGKKASTGERPKPGLTWNPTDYEAVERVLTTAPLPMLDLIAGAVRTFGSLRCPAPASNPNATYRVVLNKEGKVPVIEKQLDEQNWELVFEPDAKTLTPTRGNPSQGA